MLQKTPSALEARVAYPTMSLSPSVSFSLIILESSGATTILTAISARLTKNALLVAADNNATDLSSRNAPDIIIPTPIEICWQTVTTKRGRQLAIIIRYSVATGWVLGSAGSFKERNAAAARLLEAKDRMVAKSRALNPGLIVAAVINTRLMIIPLVAIDRRG